MFDVDDDFNPDEYYPGQPSNPSDYTGNDFEDDSQTTRSTATKKRSGPFGPKKYRDPMEEAIKAAERVARLEELGYSGDPEYNYSQSSRSSRRSKKRKKKSKRRRGKDSKRELDEDPSDDDDDGDDDDDDEKRPPRRRGRRRRQPRLAADDPARRRVAPGKDKSDKRPKVLKPDRTPQMIQKILKESQSNPFMALLENYLHEIDLNSFRHFKPAKIVTFIRHFVQNLEKGLDKEKIFRDTIRDRATFSGISWYKEKEIFNELDKKIMTPIIHLKLLARKYENEKNLPPDVKMDPKDICPCKNYIIRPGFDKPYAVSINDNVYSVLPPEHHKDKHTSIRKLGGTFKVVPNWKKERECMLISGPSGSGKTYFAKDYLRKYHKLKPRNKIYLIANKDFEDFNDVPYTKVPITREFFSKVRVNDFRDSILVFDDVENISTDEEIQRMVQKLIEEILNVGRSMHISILIISHILLNYRFSRNMIMECNKIVMFPGSGARHQYKNFLSTYVGLDKKQIDKLLKTKSRWLAIDKEAPITVITDDNVEIL